MRINTGAVILLLLLSSITIAEDGGSIDKSTGFVSACRTSRGDTVLGAGVLIALVHEVGQSSTVLYRIAQTRMEPLAELHYETSTTQEFLEAQGGVRSTAIASDMVACLEAKHFVVMRTWRSHILAQPRTSMPDCDCDYVTTKKYDASKR